MFKQKKYDAAQKDFVKALECGQKNGEPRNLLYQARISLEKGDGQAALSLAERARVLAVDPDDTYLAATALEAIAEGKTWSMDEERGRSIPSSIELLEDRGNARISDISSSTENASARETHTHATESDVPVELLDVDR